MRVAAALVALVVLASAFWVLGAAEFGVGANREASSGMGDEGARGDRRDSALPAPADGPLRREEAIALDSWRVSLDGVTARARWISGDDPTRLHRTLHDVPDGDLPPWVDLHDGMTLDLPGETWTWLCAQVEGAAGVRTVYRRLPPDARGGPLDLRPGPGASIWVLAYDAALGGPAHTTSLQSLCADGRRSTERLNALGFGTVDARCTGLVDLRLGEGDGSADPSDRSRCRLALGATAPFDAFVVTLAAPVKTWGVKLRMNVLGEGSDLARARLVFRRTDAVGSLHPLRMRLTSEMRDARIALPRGSYVVESVPPGALEIAAESGVVRVGPDSGAADVRVEASSAMCLLELRGLAVSDCPIRVRAIPAGCLDGPDAEFEFIGPYHWVRTSELVHRIACDVLIEAIGRGDAWLATGPVRIEAESAGVELRRARRVRVTWVDAPAGLAEPILAVTGGTLAEGRMVHLARRLSTRSGAERPSWVAELTVPTDALELECVDAAGRALFEHPLRSGHERVHLLFEGTPARLVSGG